MPDHQDHVHTPMTDIVDRAKELLDGITPGPWRESLLDGVDYEDGSSCYRGGIYDTTAAHIPVFLAAGGIDKRDARFIAAAPQLVADLIAEVERLKVREDVVAEASYRTGRLDAEATR